MFRRSRPCLPAAALLAASLLLLAFHLTSTAAHTVILYDGQLGGTPDQQGFSFLATGPTVSQHYSSGMTILDSTIDIREQAGYFGQKDLTLDRQVGYKLQFVVQLLQEEHGSPDRAGFSLIVLSEDLLGLELAFWQNEIWVQEGGTDEALFTHAEGVMFDTTADLIAYDLVIKGDAYALSTQGTPLLNGVLRDYTAFEGVPDVYEIPGLIFLGDDTGRGAAKTAIAYVAVETEPPAPPAMTPTSTVQPGTTPSPIPSATPLSGEYTQWLPCLKGSG